MNFNEHRPSGFSLLPVIVKNLLIVNGIFFIAKFVLGSSFGLDLDYLLGLHYPGAEDFQLYQIVSYLFMHGNFTHLFFNMFAVWMFGSAIENIWGPKRFLTYYLLTGFGAALLHYIVVYYQISPDLYAMESFIQSGDPTVLQQFVAEHQFRIFPDAPATILKGFEEFKGSYSLLIANPDYVSAVNDCTSFIQQYLEYYKNTFVVVGASGSLFGILMAFGMMFPNSELFLMFIPIPIKAKYFVIGYGVIELYSGLQNNMGDNVAHFAHLGGMLFGFILIKLWGIRRLN